MPDVLGAKDLATTVTSSEKRKSRLSRWFTGGGGGGGNKAKSTDDVPSKTGNAEPKDDLRDVYKISSIDYRCV